MRPAYRPSQVCIEIKCLLAEMDSPFDKDATVAIDPAAEPDMQTYAIRVVTSADGDLVL